MTSHLGKIKKLLKNSLKNILETNMTLTLFLKKMALRSGVSLEKITILNLSIHYGKKIETYT